jgi:hypothetical protein
MSFPPSMHHMSVLDTQPIRYASREVYLLWQRAENLERERQSILDRLQWMESREEDCFTSLLGFTHDAHPTYTLPPTNFSYGGVGVHHERSVPPPTQGYNVSTRGSPHTVSPMRPKGGGCPFILPENEGTLAFALVLCHA